MKKTAAIAAALALISIASPAQAQPTTASLSSLHRPGQPASSFQLGVDASLGYGTYFIIFDDGIDEAAHGLFTNVGLTFTWGQPNRRMGIRLRGFYAPHMSDEGMNEDVNQYSQIGGVSAGFYAKFGGFWFSPAVGLTLVTLMDERYGEPGNFEAEDTLPMPEINFCFGYDFALTRFMDLSLGAEAGTVFFMVYKFQGNVGLRFKF